MKGLSSQMKLRSAIQILAGGHVIAAGLATYIGDETWYSKCLMPCARLIGAENAHVLAVKAAKYRILPRVKQHDDSCLKTEVWGKQFSNPIGLAAGFDKHAEAVDGLLTLGFGFVEVGSVTPEPQPGNPTPRVFRITKDRAIINRYGFNSDGHKVVSERLRCRKNQKAPGIVGVNLGKNKETTDAASDFVSGVRELGPMADYLVINVSSPNTPGLRALQGRQQLQALISKVVSERNKMPETSQPPLLVKISPDLSNQDKLDIAAVLSNKESGVDGLIISNTTISRPEDGGGVYTEAGGLSGPPLLDMSTQLIRDMYRHTQGRLPIIGVGGVSSGKDAFDKLSAGASLVQIYTVFTYDGPPVVNKIKRELTDILHENGLTSVSEAVGKDFTTRSRLEHMQAPSHTNKTLITS